MYKSYPISEEATGQELENALNYYGMRGYRLRITIKAFSPYLIFEKETND